ncbi:MAG: DUF116 domain-containing protein [bacterium]|jgi:hypothetical protein
MKARKRLYLGVLLLGLVIIFLTAVAVWRLLVARAGSLERVLLLTTASGLSILLLAALGGILAVVATVLRGKMLAPLRKIMFLTVHLLFPFVLKLAQMLRLDVRQVEGSFIELNNYLVRLAAPVVKPEKLLLLIPHCLQNTECPHKITNDIGNCQRCGRCKISELLSLCDEYGANMAVATGGTLARQFVRRYRPQAIVAVACERDLSSGIQDTAPLPVLGVLNERPEGPCRNTQVDLRKVKEAIEFFLTGGEV